VTIIGFQELLQQNPRGRKPCASVILIVAPQHLISELTNFNRRLTLTRKKAFTIWLLIVLASLAILATLHAWILWQVEHANIITIFSFSLEITLYLIATMSTAFLFIGAVCYVVFRGDSIDLQLYQLGKDFEEKFAKKCEEIKDLTNDSLMKLGLNGFQLKENLKDMQERLEELETHGKILQETKGRLAKIEHKMSVIDATRKDLSSLKKKLQAIKNVQKDLKNIQGIVAKLDFIPRSYLTSSDEMKILEGKILESSTVRKLELNDIRKIEDFLLKNPVEIAVTEAMSESEAKSLQSIIQLLMIPGIQHEDAVLLLKSGVNSKQELAVQDTFSLGARIAKTAELYIKEGKIEDNEKPTLEEIAAWIRLAKTH